MNNRNIVFLSFALCLAGCVSTHNAAKEQIPSPLHALSPAATDGTIPELSLLNANQLAFLDMPRKERHDKFDNPQFRKANTKACTQVPQIVHLAWTNVLGKACTLSVRNLYDGREVKPVRQDAWSADLDNLEIGRTYEWVVTSGKFVMKNQFKTSPRAPRLMNVPGVPNVRDLGGRTGLDGRRVRQGRLIRTAGLNGNAGFRCDTLEEALEKDGDGSLKARAESIRKAAEELKASTDEPVPVKVEIAAEWKATNKDGTAIRIATNNCVRMPIERDQTKMTTLEGIIVADNEGLASFECGGDWFWNFSVNGTEEYNRFTGNGKGVDISNYEVTAPVKKGTNTVTVVISSGSQGYCFHIRPTAKTPSELKDIRSAQLAALAENAHCRAENLGLHKGRTRINDQNRDFLLKVLGLKSDIDLRSDRECQGMTGSPLGNNVTWFHISSSAYAGMKDNNAKEAFAKVFKVMLDEKNYPIVFHCIGGQDRTGTVAFILNGILGVEDEELIRDWEATAFTHPECNWFNHVKRFDPMWELFASFPGETMTDKCVWYVKSCGFTDKDIAKFRKLMLE